MLFTKHKYIPLLFSFLHPRKKVLGFAFLFYLFLSAPGSVSGHSVCGCNVLIQSEQGKARIAFATHLLLNVNFTETILRRLILALSHTHWYTPTPRQVKCQQDTHAHTRTHTHTHALTLQHCKDRVNVNAWPEEGRNWRWLNAVGANGKLANLNPITPNHLRTKNLLNTLITYASLCYKSQGIWPGLASSYQTSSSASLSLPIPTSGPGPQGPSGALRGPQGPHIIIWGSFFFSLQKENKQPTTQLSLLSVFMSLFVCLFGSPLAVTVTMAALPEIQNTFIAKCYTHLI